MTGAVMGWAIPIPHSNIGSRWRALMAAIADANQRRQSRPRRTKKPFYPGHREPMFEEAAMQREMYRL
ncbi:hypothetical protein ABIA30_005054 [Mycobacterium sp. MAA66]|jgi:hypothetical protein|uniref:hypothetical protein n=1 Tax=Mycobacterium sp. MAA66 TaxID=3156297 RepID=UPI0035159EE6